MESAYDLKISLSKFIRLCKETLEKRFGKTIKEHRIEVGKRYITLMLTLLAVFHLTLSVSLATEINDNINISSQYVGIPQNPQVYNYIIEQATVNSSKNLNEVDLGQPIQNNNKNDDLIPNIRSNLTYPDYMWERIWYSYDPLKNGFTEFLGYGPHEESLMFSNHWGPGVLAYGKQDYVGFISTRTIYLDYGRWLFIIGSDDGFRLYLDDKLVLDKWGPLPYEFFSYEVSFSESKSHRILLEYFELGGEAAFSFIILKLYEESETFFTTLPNIYVLNIRESPGMWTTPSFVTTQLVSELNKYGFKFEIIDEISKFDKLLLEQPRGIVVINTHGELVPISRRYVRNETPEYLRLLRDIREAVGESGWIWVNIAGYPFYYVGNRMYKWVGGDVSGAYRVGEVGLKLFLGDPTAWAFSERYGLYASMEPDAELLRDSLQMHFMKDMIKNERMIKSLLQPYFTLYSNGEWRAIAAYKIGKGWFINSYASLSNELSSRMAVASLAMLYQKLGFVNVRLEFSVDEVSGVGWYPKGSRVNITIRGLEMASGGIIYKPYSNLVRHRLEGWLVNGEPKVPTINLSLVANSHILIKPVWKNQYYVNVSSHCGKVTGSGWYDEGQEIKISLDSEVVYVDTCIRCSFIGWEGDYESQNITFSIRVSKPLKLVATWKVEYLIKVSVEPPNLVSKVLEWNEKWVKQGEAVFIQLAKEVLVSPGTKYSFKEWSGDIMEANIFESTIEMHVFKPIKLKAIYEPWHQVTAESPYGNISGIGWYNSGSKVRLSISPTKYGFPIVHIFDGWNRNGVKISDFATYDFIVTEPVRLEALWRVDYTPLITIIVAAVFVVSLAMFTVSKSIKKKVRRDELKRINDSLMLLEELYKTGRISGRAYEILKQEYEERKRQLE